MSEITPLTKDQLFEKKIAENTGSDYNVGDISDVVPVTKDQAFLKEIALNSAGQSGDISELEGKVTANAGAIEAIVNEYGAKNLYNYILLTSQTFSDLTVTVNADKSITIVGTNNSGSDKIFYTNSVAFDIPAGSYLVNGGLDASVESDIRVIFYHGIDNEVIYNGDASYTFNSTVGCNFLIVVNDGATVNATIKPMIRDARIADDTYVPYAMTNRELTERQIKYKDFHFTELGSNGLNGLTASAVVGARVLPNPSSLPATAHIPLCFNYGGNADNWNIRWFDRDTGAMITPSISVTFDLRVFYID